MSKNYKTAKNLKDGQKLYKYGLRSKVKTCPKNDKTLSKHDNNMVKK